MELLKWSSPLSEKKSKGTRNVAQMLETLTLHPQLVQKVMTDTTPPVLWFAASSLPHILIGIQSSFPLAQAAQNCLLTNPDTQ